MVQRLFKVTMPGRARTTSKSSEDVFTASQLARDDEREAQRACMYDDDRIITRKESQVSNVAPSVQAPSQYICCVL